MVLRLLGLLIVIGVGLLIGGAKVLSRSPDAPVTCHGQAMNQGDYCHLYSKGAQVMTSNPSDSSYDQMKAVEAPNPTKGITFVVIGSAVAIGSGVSTGYLRRKWRTKSR
jgi:hypothetical protein